MSLRNQVKLKSLLRKFYDHHHGLVNRYGVFVSTKKYKKKNKVITRMLEELFIFIDIILFYFQWMIYTVLCILWMMTRMLEKQTVFFSLQLLLRVSTFIYIFINKSGLFEWKRTWAGFLSFVYTCIAFGDPVVMMGGFGSH